MIDEQHNIFDDSPIHCGLCQSAPCECPGHDERIPVETRRELMQCAVSNGHISYHYLCDLWKRGRRASEARAEAAEATVTRLREERDKACWFESVTVAGWQKRAEAAESREARLREALESIANNSCCTPCREAGMVARQALNAVLHGRDPEGA